MIRGYRFVYYVLPITSIFVNGLYKSCLTVRLKGRAGTKVGHKILELRYTLDKLIKATLGITA